MSFLPIRRPSLRPLSVLALAAGLTVVALAALAIVNLRDQADTRRAVATRVQTLEANALRLEAIGWEALAEPDSDYSNTLAARRITRLLRADAAAVAAVDPKAARLPVLTRVLGAAIRSELEAIRDDRRGRARIALMTQLLGTTEILGSDVREAGDRARQSAGRADATAERGSLIAISLVALLMCGLTGAIGWARRRTGRARAEATTRSARRSRAILERSSEIVVLIDREGRVVDVTDAALRRVLGWAADDVLGWRLPELLNLADRPMAAAALTRLADEPGFSSPTEWTIRGADGREVQLRVTGNNLLSTPEVGALVLTLQDVTAQREMEEALRHQAFHDALTGLPNRALFEDRLRHALHRVGRASPGVAVAFVDLDDFKAVNDSLGHAAGDELLVEVARRLDDVVRVGDTAARLGGDEFAVLLEDAEDVAPAAAVAARLRAALAVPVLLDGRDITVRASIGLVHSGSEDAAGDLLRKADVAMYAAKSSGGGRERMFVPGMLDAARERLDIREDLRFAVARNELRVHYQPIVALDDRRAVAYEALMRWEHPVHGMLAPDRFIPIAEETGQIVELGRWVLDRACRDVAGVGGDVTVSVNVSALQLADDDFAGDVSRALRAAGLPAGRLTLELTETCLADEGASARVRELRSLGVGVSVDDFGTGYSSLSHLHTLDVTSVKIDRAFIADIAGRPRDAALVRSIVELAHRLGLVVVGEGVETGEQATALMDLGCEMAQGYHFGRPRPLADGREDGPASVAGALGGAAS